MDDVLEDTAALFGDVLDDDGTIHYGQLVLTVAPKANTLLADHLFSPSLLLAEQIERGLIHLSGQSIVELGAGCALPSLLSSTLSPPPSLVVITDYPDATILGNLEKNVERNEQAISDGCRVHYRGYEWGQDVAPLLALLPAGHDGFDTVILSDLLHFDRAHDALLASLAGLLRRAPGACAYVAAGTYTPPHVCDRFLQIAEAVGLVWEERPPDGAWKGALPVAGGGLDVEQLAVRKGMCRSWVARWSDAALVASG
ncbi:hypothetical protein POSPLADRAFT_1047161 [Postia placenta MAD-698-R-SB12]|uniref:Nicotinamide N-methyltransferase n=1 Tax=Postia placenta MAD-698-R-SB12 TaxID=670580 RepID=A0A1X6MWP5_9APHY|nr:hypothetical protein POSPLADRAFT_1047161 [Postia placenta MAD-698-R-SB12]OSX60795.1 hypothetical protein POSPLADRAFT_1047161 [Postia placenta MAD-698-R-SB12]